MKISGIYQIQSTKIPTKSYIGSAFNISKRWYMHLNLLRKNTHPNPKLQNHFNKYGEADFQFSILLGCPKEDLIKTEQYFIDSYNPYFNICKTAGSQFGLKRSIETKIKISTSKKGKPTWNKGKKGIYSDETLRNMSESHIGRTQSEEWKIKISNSMKGKQNCLGNKLTIEHKIEIGNSLRGRKYKKHLK